MSNNLTESYKRLFFDDEVDIVINNKHYGLDDFFGALLPESLEYIRVCEKVAKGEQADFNKAVNDYADWLINITLDNMTKNEMNDFLGKI